MIMKSFTLYFLSFVLSLKSVLVNGAIIYMLQDSESMIQSFPKG